MKSEDSGKEEEGEEERKGDDSDFVSFPIENVQIRLISAEMVGFQIHSHVDI